MSPLKNIIFTVSVKVYNDVMNQVTSLKQPYISFDHMYIYMYNSEALGSLAQSPKLWNKLITLTRCSSLCLEDSIVGPWAKGRVFLDPSIPR